MIKLICLIFIAIVIIVGIVSIILTHKSCEKELKEFNEWIKKEQ